MKARLAAAVVLLALTAGTATAQTRITKVSSSRVQLAAGSAAQLTVEGTDLTSVTGVRLLLNGRVVEGVEGSVARARTADGLAIQLSAASAVPAGSYQLELVSAGQRIRVPVQVTITAADLRPPPRAAGEMTVRAPSVSGATPTAVSLEAGAAATTVTVTGALLNQVRGAYVERNGVRISAVRAELLPASVADRRDVQLNALASGAPLNEPLDLVLEAGAVLGTSSAVRVATPVRVTVTPSAFRFSGDGPLRGPVESVLSGARLSFNSCGGSDAERRFTFSLPDAGYNASGSVARLENTLDLPERVAFAEAHSITPNDIFNPAQFANLGTTGHPSPIPHGLSALRLCLQDMSGGGTWNISFTRTKTSPTPVVITVTYPSAFFLGRGMPAAAAGVPDGLNIGIRWGDAVTDREVPDLVYMQPAFEIRFPLDVVNGSVVPGTATVTFKGAAPKWSATFLGPSQIRTQLEQHAAARIQQMAQEVGKAFNAGQTKNAISSAIMASLRSNGVGEVIGIQATSDGGWSVTYRN